MTRQGVDLVHRYPLEVAAFQKSPKFVLAREDPAVYTNEDLEGYNPSESGQKKIFPKLQSLKQLLLFLQS